MSGPTGVSELVLEVVDLERAVRFYTEDLQLPLVERWEQREAAWVMAGDHTPLGLLPPPNASGSCPAKPGFTGGDDARVGMRRARHSAVPAVLSFAPRARLPRERRPENGSSSAQL